MSGVILHANKELRERTLDRLQRRHEAAQGKKDILLTWEEKGVEVCAPEFEYLAELRARIRKERVLLSHMRP